MARLVVFVALVSATAHAGTPWHDPASPLRRRIAPVSVLPELSGFPVYVQLPGPPPPAQVRFFSAEGAALPHEHAGGGSYWVRLAELEEPFFVYFGDPNATDSAHPTEVWSNRYRAVWHLDGPATADAKDSTAFR